MGLGGIWLAVFLGLGLVFLIILIVLKYLNSRKSGKGLFGDSAPYYFKGVLKRLNPFLIVKKHGKEFHLKKQGNAEDDKLIILNDGNEKGTSFRKGSEGNKIQIKNPSNNLEKGPNQQNQQGKQEQIQKSQRNQQGHSNKKETTPRKNSIVVSDDEKKKLLKKYNEKEELVRKKGMMIKVNDLDSLSKRLKDKEVVHVLNHLKKENYALIEKLFLGKTFGSENEFMEYLKEEIVIFLESEVNLLKDRLSDLRKKGLDVNDLALKVMAIPLKIKLFSASFEIKDFDKIISMLDKRDLEIKKVEQEEVKKEEEEKQQAANKTPKQGF